LFMASPFVGAVAFAPRDSRPLRESNHYALTERICNY
jgi:hypothetical protein